MVAIGDRTAREELTVDDGRTRSVRRLLQLADDGTHAPGETATVEVSPKREGTVEDAATRTETVGGRDQRCTGER